VPGIPGLVVNRFADCLVVQITTAGTERMKDRMVDALNELLKPKGILLRNDSSSRELEDLPMYSKVVR